MKYIYVLLTENLLNLMSLGETHRLPHLWVGNKQWMRLLLIRLRQHSDAKRQTLVLKILLSVKPNSLYLIIALDLATSLFVILSAISPILLWIKQFGRIFSTLHHLTFVCRKKNPKTPVKVSAQVYQDILNQA